MTPATFATLLIALTSLALAWSALHRYDRRRKLRGVARELKLNSCMIDRFQLRQRAARLLPIPGAADVEVDEVLYGRLGDFRIYMFHVSWTIGATSFRKRRSAAAVLVEDADHNDVELRLGKGGLRDPVEKYRQLYALLEPA